MKKLLFLVLGLLFGFTAFGSHYLGGEITWRCFDSGPNAGQFKFYVILYRECGVGASTFLPNPVILSTNAPGGSISCAQTGSATDVSPNCYDTSQEIQCNSVSSGEGAIEERRYESGYITLSGVPPAGGWYFTFTDCCRPNLTNLTGGASYTLRAYMFPYSITGVPQNTSTCFDSSPRFLEPPKSVLCTGYEATYFSNPMDDDRDSISFRWAWPQTSSNGTNASFTTGYTYNNPFPNGGNTVSINQQTGAITFQPTSGGSFASCIEVESYRCNQKIASVYRDVPVIIKTNCPTNTPPVMTVQNIPSYPTVIPVVNGTDTLYWETTVTAGSLLKFRFEAQDADLNGNFMFQNIEASPSSVQYGAPLNSPVSGCFQPPCATINPVAPQTSFAAILNNVLDFEWQTTCDHLAYTPLACGGLTNTYVFVLRMQDDACPAPATSVDAVVVHVIPSIPTPPDSAWIVSSTTAATEINWSLPLDTGIHFTGYAIFRADSSANPFLALDTIWDYAQLSYIDSIPFVGLNTYYISTLGACGVASSPSDTLTCVSNINLDETSLSVAPRLQPNPTDGIFTLHLPTNSQQVPYQLLSSAGQVIQEGVANDEEVEFNLMDKPKGVYQLVLLLDTGPETLSVVLR